MPDPAARAVRDCQHPGKPHQHGTPTAYTQDACRCGPCTAAHSKAKALYRLARLNGEKKTTPAAPVRDHLRKFIDANIGYPQIANATGVPATTLRHIVLGTKQPDGTRRPPERVTTRTAQRILATPTPHHPDPQGRGVDPTGARRRIQALMALGWSTTRIAHHAGVNRSTIANVLAGKPPHAEVRDRIIAAYERLQHHRPEARTEAEARAIARTLNRAAKAGWAPPAAWDEEDLDNPEAPEPTAAAPTRRAGYGEVFDEWLFLVDHGTDPEQATLRVGISNLRTLRRAARKHGRLDVLTRLDSSTHGGGIPAGRLADPWPA